uniref:Uncharacterized protein n=1 Tax=Magallana gigas TaxID=29159 RepID=K1QDG3_MAGGI
MEGEEEQDKMEPNIEAGSYTQEFQLQSLLRYFRAPSTSYAMHCRCEAHSRFKILN